MLNSEHYPRPLTLGCAWNAVTGVATTVWNHLLGSFDWGTTAAGAVSVIYGGYKIVTGVDEAAFSVALLFAPPPFNALAIPAGMLSVYQVTTGVAREVRSGDEVQRRRQRASLCIRPLASWVPARISGIGSVVGREA